MLHHYLGFTFELVKNGPGDLGEVENPAKTKDSAMSYVLVNK